MQRPLIGKANMSGDFDIVWRSDALIRADPYLVAYDRSLGR
jgi:branched-chain amino acid transport system substrate-binding protein